MPRHLLLRPATCGESASEDAIRQKKRGFELNFDDTAGNGPGRCCSPRHRMAFDSRREGLKYVSMTWRAINETLNPKTLNPKP